MKRILLSLTVGSIVGTIVFNTECATAFWGKTLSADGVGRLRDEYQKKLNSGQVRAEKSSISRDDQQKRTAFSYAWKKSGHEGSAWLGSWSADSGLAALYIYPSSLKKNRVCIVIATENSQFHPGHVNRGAVYLDDGSLIFTDKDKLVHYRSNGRFNQLAPSTRGLPNQSDRQKNLPEMRNSQQTIDRQIANEGCTTDMPEGATIVAKPKSNTPTYSTKVGEAAYFSWQWQTGRGTSESSEPRMVAGYGCLIRNQMAGVTRQAFASRYKLIRFRGTDEWALEFVDGILVSPTEQGYVAQKVPEITGEELKPYVSDRESGFLKKEMGAADGLGVACVNDGMAGVLKNIRQEYKIAIDIPGELTADEPIAQPTEPVKTLPPIARASTYAYPSPEEFTQFRQTLKTQPSQKLSAADNQSRQTFLKKWQTDNPPIAPFIGTWTTREGRSIYVYPSTQRLRACVVTVKNGNPSFTMALAQGPELRYGNSGLFKTEQGDLLASRQEGEKDLVPVFAAVGVPVLSEDVQQELAQAKCGGMAIGPAGR